MSIEISDFGNCENGKFAKIFTLTNSNNMFIKLTNYGAILVSVLLPNQIQSYDDVVLGFDTLDKYSSNDICYFGSTVGRNSSRISNAQFTLNEKIYDLDKNEKNKNNLHSGFNPYNERYWDYSVDEENNSVTFSLFSPDGDQGFPGDFNVSVTYTLTNSNEVKIEYSGTSNKDTIANMTNHSYFNLSGHDSGTALNQYLYINSNKYAEIDDELIPTGNFIDVTNTPLDFRTSKQIGIDINNPYKQMQLAGGFDHSFIIDKKDNSIEKIAVLRDEKTNRTMEVYSDCMALQFYAGNFIENNTILGKNNYSYKNRSGICLETGFLPDAINQKKFVSPILKAGDTYHTTTIYKFIF